MKVIVAVIRPPLVPRLVDVLSEVPSIEFGSVKEIKGFGRQKNYLNEYHGSEYSEAFIPKVFVELRVDDEALESVLETIMKTARTGRMGDGKIFVFGGDAFLF